MLQIIIKSKEENGNEIEFLVENFKNKLKILLNKFSKLSNVDKTHIELHFMNNLPIL